MCGEYRQVLYDFLLVIWVGGWREKAKRDGVGICSDFFSDVMWFLLWMMDVRLYNSF